MKAKRMKLDDMKRKKMQPYVANLLGAAFLWWAALPLTAQNGYGRLTVEGRQSPMGLDELQPRMGWQIVSDKKNVVQKAYRLLVATSREKLEADEGDVWDTHTVQSDRSQNVVYAGPALHPNTTYYWKVKAKTNKGRARWSPVAQWSTGLMGDANWTGRWIGTDSLLAHDSCQKHSRATGRYFRREFETCGDVRRATVHVSGLGYYALWLNGRRVNRNRLSPVPTDYAKSVAYDSYDVTSLLGRSNAIGAVVAPGYYFAPRQSSGTDMRPTYGLPRLRLDLIIEYADGRADTVATGPSWRMNADGPLRWSNLYDGEMYDSRLDFAGWTQPGFDDSRWAVAPCCQAPGGTMRGSLTEPVTVYETDSPVSLRKMGRRYLIDFGTNGAGVVSLRVHAAKGDTVRVHHAELLEPGDSTLYTDNLRSAQATAWYVADGKARRWQPEFTWFGFRYAEVTGVERLEPEDVERLLISDNLSRMGNSIRFVGADTLNLVMEAAYRGIRSNYKGMPMDCPQRDERMPWTGDRTMGCLGESYVLDVRPLYAKWLDDMADSQLPNGALSDVMPAYWRLYNTNMTWPAVLPFACEMMRRQYGDDRTVARHYGHVDRWLRHVRSYRWKDGLITYDRYGDWCVPPESAELIHSKDPARQTDSKLISSCYYAYLCQLMAGYAVTQGKETDHNYYMQEADTTCRALNAAYLHNGTYANGTVTANLLPLAMRLVPADQEAAVRDALLRTIEERNHGMQSCGVVGVQWLMRYLAGIGRGDLAWRMATSTAYPGWGYMVSRGATTIWELWNGDTANPSMNSGNHVMLLGDLLPWAYEQMGGLRSSDTDPGFHRTVMAPDFSVEACAGVEASHESPYGTVRSNWHREGNGIVWTVTVPPNTTAELHLPGGKTRIVGSGVYRMRKEMEK